MSVIGPDREMAAGPNLDLGSADTFTIAGPDDPGRYMIAVSGAVPVLPQEEAAKILTGLGFVVAASARNDACTALGWTQVASAWWTAPCHPIAP
ncbi:hypothetical protein [Streptomyces graminilatus]|uniref:hypothetical protein n=1 Tax=Streptomyces graminilatus TaxID=1464070 RepID=UPI0006E30AA1|nr:hypothetical protein [Streptomyces graminilatus]